jgi:H+/Cl- antiporter ClcA
LLVKIFAKGSRGSGIPQVIATIQEKSELHLMAKRFLSLPVLIIKILSSSIAVLGGGAIGREGPSIQISAAIFRLFREKWIKFGGKAPSYHNMLVAGAAGGLAAAFNTPLGGIVYAVEELTKDHVSNFRLGLLESITAAGFVAQLINGPYLFLGFPILPTVNSRLLVYVVLIALICGLFGAIFGKALHSMLKWREQIKGTWDLILSFCIGLMLAGIIFYAGEKAMGSGKLMITEILFKGNPAELIDIFTRFFNPLITSMAGVAGGIFAPALAAGASIGSYVSSQFFPQLGNLGAICGMIGFLTGLTRAPVTSFVLIMEMTDRHSAVFAMMLSAILAQIVARVIDSKSYYEKAAEDYHLTPPKS